MAAPNHTVADPTDYGTLRPNSPPIPTTGTCFQPLDCPDFEYKINLPSSFNLKQPVYLFLLYYNRDIINLIVDCTNQNERLPRDPDQFHARAKAWVPTCSKEIYIYLAIRIYMTTVKLHKVSDYWSDQWITPKCPIANYMSRNRFQELNIRYRFTVPGIKDIFERVSLYLT